MSAFDNWLRDDVLDGISEIAIEEYESGKSIPDILKELHRVISVSIERAIYNVLDLSDRDREDKQ